MKCKSARYLGGMRNRRRSRLASNFHCLYCPFFHCLSNWFFFFFFFCGGKNTEHALIIAFTGKKSSRNLQQKFLTKTSDIVVVLAFSWLELKASSPPKSTIWLHPRTYNTHVDVIIYNLCSDLLSFPNKCFKKTFFLNFRIDVIERVCTLLRMVMLLTPR